MNDGLISLGAAILATVLINFFVAIAVTPREIIIIFGDLKVEYRQY